jgi:hypothetical protein
MTTGRSRRLLAFGLAGIVLSMLTGCGGVNRRFVIESNVPNAQVYIDNRPIGPAPAHAPFEYYGHYNIKLVHPDYQTENQRVHVVAPWYAYPPFDFLAEVVWPFRIDDVRRYYIELSPAVRTDTSELIRNADSLRERGMNLPAPEEPAEPRGEPPSVVPPPVVVPSDATLPPPAPVPSSPPPLIPSVTP